MKLFMKTWGMLITVSILSMKAMAQPNYPSAPPPPADMQVLEYFFDSDPGIGKATTVVLPSAAEIGGLVLNVSLAGVNNGLHRLYVRTRSADGVWSHTGQSFFDNYQVPVYVANLPDPAPVTAIEYFIDNDPGNGNGTAIAVVNEQDVSQVIAVNILSLTKGIHRLFIRSKDASGKWSLTHFGLFDNSASIPYPESIAAPPVGEMEYFLDNDPGLGNGTPLPVTAANDISNLSVDIPLNSLAAGMHTLYVRSRQNPWSLTAYASFVYGAPLPVRWLYVQGSINNGAAVLEWATATETNTLKFVIEHSKDGQHFDAIGELPAGGNSENTQRYRFLHASLEEGFHYYRIKQVDQDDRFEYTRIIVLLNRQDVARTMVAPNPVIKTLHIIHARPEELLRVEVLDVSGKSVLQQGFGNSRQVFSIDLDKLPRGYYTVRLVYKNSIATHKIIKQ